MPNKSVIEREREREREREKITYMYTHVHIHIYIQTTEHATQMYTSIHTSIHMCIYHLHQRGSRPPAHTNTSPRHRPCSPPHADRHPPWSTRVLGRRSRARSSKKHPHCRPRLSAPAAQRERRCPPAHHYPLPASRLAAQYLGPGASCLAGMLSGEEHQHAPVRPGQELLSLLGPRPSSSHPAAIAREGQPNTVHR